MKAKYTITRQVNIGIWDNVEEIARIYEDKTIARLATVKWSNNSGTLSEKVDRITLQAHQDILAAMAKAQAGDDDEYDESDVWMLITEHAMCSY